MPSLSELLSPSTTPRPVHKFFLQCSLYPRTCLRNFSTSISFSVSRKLLALLTVDDTARSDHRWGWGPRETSEEAYISFDTPHRGADSWKSDQFALNSLTPLSLCIKPVSGAPYTLVMSSRRSGSSSSHGSKKSGRPHVSKYRPWLGRHVPGQLFASCIAIVLCIVRG